MIHRTKVIKIDSAADLHRLGAHSLVLAGGEPYARKDFPAILRAAADLGFIIAVVTNGSYLTADVLRDFPTGNCRITLSVDGIDAHHAIRGGRSTFPLMVEKIKLLKSMEIPCSISTVISKANIHEQPRLLNWCIETTWSLGR